MPRPRRIRYPGAKYHVTSRGNGRARIFLCEADYLRFLDQLSWALDADQVILYAFCCMPNHIHLEVETQRDIAKRFGYRDGSSVGKPRQALAARLAEDPALPRHVARIEKSINALKSEIQV